MGGKDKEKILSIEKTTSNIIVKGKIPFKNHSF